MAKFVELTTKNDSKVTVNPENIVSVEHKEANFFSKDISVVTTKDGNKIEVQGSRTEITNKLNKE